MSRRVLLEAYSGVGSQLHLTRQLAVMVLEGLAAAAEKAQAPLTAGLRSFQVMPKSTSGKHMIADKMELFDHMVRLARRTTSGKVELRPPQLLYERREAPKITDGPARPGGVDRRVHASQRGGEEVQKRSRRLRAL